MGLIFGMISSSFDFFIDLGNRVNFMGWNMWDISFFVFAVSIILRWLYPLIFGASVSGTFLGSADSVKRGISDRVSAERKSWNSVDDD